MTASFRYNGRGSLVISDGSDDSTNEVFSSVPFVGGVRPLVLGAFLFKP